MTQSSSFITSFVTPGFLTDSLWAATKTGFRGASGPPRALQLEQLCFGLFRVHSKFHLQNTEPLGVIDSEAS